jgi:hypothetical protein
MAQELYVGKILTNEMITAGKRFLQQIETAMPITASFWFYVSEAERWRLFIVTPLVLTVGIREACNRVLNILDADSDDEYTVSFIHISVTDDNHQYVSSLRMMRLSDKIFEKRLTGIGVNGSHYIEDAYIYRLYGAKNDEYSRPQALPVNERSAAMA